MASDNQNSGCLDDPNFATICSFIDKFGEICNINTLSFGQLQEMLENTNDVPLPLVQLHIQLLRRVFKSINTSKWEKSVSKFAHMFNSQDGWEIERFGYKKSKMQTKLRILKNLLESQFDYNNKFKVEVNKLPASDLRLVPIGRDAEGHSYWYQVDLEANLRVYREDVDEETWEVVASSREEMEELIAQLKTGEFRKPKPADDNTNEEDVHGLESMDIEAKEILLDTGKPSEDDVNGNDDEDSMGYDDGGSDSFSDSMELKGEPFIDELVDNEISDFEQQIKLDSKAELENSQSEVKPLIQTVSSVALDAPHKSKSASLPVPVNSVVPVRKNIAETVGDLDSATEERKEKAVDSRILVGNSQNTSYANIAKQVETAADSISIEKRSETSASKTETTQSKNKNQAIKSIVSDSGVSGVSLVPTEVLKESREIISEYKVGIKHEEPRSNELCTSINFSGRNKNILNLSSSALSVNTATVVKSESDQTSISKDVELKTEPIDNVTTDVAKSPYFKEFARVETEIKSTLKTQVLATPTLATNLGSTKIGVFITPDAMRESLRGSNLDGGIASDSVDKSDPQPMEVEAGIPLNIARHTPKMSKQAERVKESQHISPYFQSVDKVLDKATDLSIRPLIPEFQDTRSEKLGQEVRLKTKEKLQMRDSLEAHQSKHIPHKLPPKPVLPKASGSSGISEAWGTNIHLSKDSSNIPQIIDTKTKEVYEPSAVKAKAYLCGDSLAVESKSKIFENQDWSTRRKTMIPNEPLDLGTSFISSSLPSHLTLLAKHVNMDCLQSTSRPQEKQQEIKNQMTPQAKAIKVASIEILEKSSETAPVPVPTEKSKFMQEKREQPIFVLQPESTDAVSILSNISSTKTKTSRALPTLDVPIALPVLPGIETKSRKVDSGLSSGSTYRSNLAGSAVSDSSSVLGLPEYAKEIIAKRKYGIPDVAYSTAEKSIMEGFPIPMSGTVEAKKYLADRIPPGNRVLETPTFPTARSSIDAILKLNSSLTIPDALLKTLESKPVIVPVPVVGGVGKMPRLDSAVVSEPKGPVFSSAGISTQSSPYVPSPEKIKKHVSIADISANLASRSMEKAGSVLKSTVNPVAKGLEKSHSVSKPSVDFILEKLEKQKRILSAQDSSSSSVVEKKAKTDIASTESTTTPFKKKFEDTSSARASNISSNASATSQMKITQIPETSLAPSTNKAYGQITPSSDSLHQKIVSPTDKFHGKLQGSTESSHKQITSSTDISHEKISLSTHKPREKTPTSNISNEKIMIAGDKPVEHTVYSSTHKESEKTTALPHCRTQEQIFPSAFGGNVQRVLQLGDKTLEEPHKIIASPADKTREKVAPCTAKPHDKVSTSTEKTRERIGSSTDTHIEKIALSTGKADPKIVPSVDETHKKVMLCAVKPHDKIATSTEKTHEKIAPSSDKAKDKAPSSTDKADPKIVPCVDKTHEKVTLCAANPHLKVTTSTEKTPEKIESSSDIANDKLAPTGAKIAPSVKAHDTTVSSADKTPEKVAPYAVKPHDKIGSSTELKAPEKIASPSDKANEKTAPSADRVHESTLPALDKTDQKTIPVSRADLKVVPSADKADRKIVLAADKAREKTVPSVDKADQKIVPAEDKACKKTVPSTDKADKKIVPAGDSARETTVPSVGTPGLKIVPSACNVDQKLLTSTDKGDQNIVPSGRDNTDSKIRLAADKANETAVSSVSTTVPKNAPPTGKADQKMVASAGKAEQKIVPSANEGVKKIVPSVDEGVKKMVSFVSEGVKKIVPSADEGVKKIVPSANEGVKKIVPSANEGVKKIVPSADADVKKIVPSVGEGDKKIVSSVGEGAKKIVPSAEEGVKKIVPSADEGVKKILPSADEGVKKIVPSADEGVKKIVPSAEEGVKKIVPSADEGVKKIVPPADEGVKKIVPSADEGVKKIVPPADEGVKKIVPSADEGVKKIVPSADEGVKKIVPSAGEGVKKIVPSADEGVKKIVPSAGEGFKKMVPPVSTADLKIVPSAAKTDRRILTPSDNAHQEIATPGDRLCQRTVTSVSTADLKIVSSADKADHKMVPSADEGIKKIVPSAEKGDQKTVPTAAKADQKTLPSAEKADQKIVPSAEKADQKIVPSAGNADEKIVHSADRDELKIVSAVDKARETTVFSGRTLDLKIVPSAVKVDQKIVPPTGKTDEKIVPPTGKTDQKNVPSADKAVQKIVPSVGNVDQKLLLSADKADQKIVPSADKAGEKTVSAVDKVEQKIVSAVDKVEQKILSAVDKVEQKIVPTAGSQDPKLLHSADKADQKTVSSAEKSDQKTVSSAEKSDQKTVSAADIVGQKIVPSLSTKDLKILPSAGSMAQKLLLSADQADQKVSSADKAREKTVPLAYKVDEKIVSSGSKMDLKIVPAACNIDQNLLPLADKVDQKILPSTDKADEKIPSAAGNTCEKIVSSSSRDASFVKNAPSSSEAHRVIFPATVEPNDKILTSTDRSRATIEASTEKPHANMEPSVEKLLVKHCDEKPDDTVDLRKIENPIKLSETKSTTQTKEKLEQKNIVMAAPIGTILDEKEPGNKLVVDSVKHHVSAGTSNLGDCILPTLKENVLHLKSQENTVKSNDSAKKIEISAEAKVNEFSSVVQIPLIPFKNSVPASETKPVPVVANVGEIMGISELESNTKAHPCVVVDSKKLTPVPKNIPVGEAQVASAEATIVTSAVTLPQPTAMSAEAFRNDQKLDSIPAQASDKIVEDLSSVTKKVESSSAEILSKIVKVNETETVLTDTIKDTITSKPRPLESPSVNKDSVSHPSASGVIDLVVKSQPPIAKPAVAASKCDENPIAIATDKFLPKKEPPKLVGLVGYEYSDSEDDIDNDGVVIPAGIGATTLSQKTEGESSGAQKRKHEPGSTTEQHDAKVLKLTSSSSNPSISTDNPIVGEAIEEDVFMVTGSGEGALNEGGNGSPVESPLPEASDETLQDEEQQNSPTQGHLPPKPKGRGRPRKNPAKEVLRDKNFPETKSPVVKPASRRNSLNFSEDVNGTAASGPVRRSGRVAQIRQKEEEERRKLEEERLAQLKDAQIRKQQKLQEREVKAAKQGPKSPKHQPKAPKSPKGSKQETYIPPSESESESEQEEEEAEEYEGGKKPGKKRRKRKTKNGKPVKRGGNPWLHSSSEDDEAVEEEEEEEHYEEEEEEELVFNNGSDHEFSPESDIGEESEFSPSRHARTAKTKEAAVDKYAETYCDKCAKGDHPEWILLCDQCDKGWHASCVNPQLWVIPEGEWYCPPCQHAMLVVKLSENLIEYDKILKKRENEVLRKQRLAYVGISLNNVLPSAEKAPTDKSDEENEGYVKNSRNRSGRRRRIYSDEELEDFINDKDDEFDDGSESGSVESEEEPMYQLRARRATKGFSFQEYDDMINTALRGDSPEPEEEKLAEESEEVTKNGISEELEVKEKESDDKKEAKDKKGSEDDEPEGENKVPIRQRVNPIKDDDSEEEELDEKEKNRRQILNQGQKKSRRRLNDLDATSEEDSDEDFKGSADDDDDEDEDNVVEEDSDWSEDDESDDSIAMAKIAKKKRRHHGPLGRKEKYEDGETVRRSTRRKKSRVIYDESDQDEDEDDQEEKWQTGESEMSESDSESDDETWGKKKKQKKPIGASKSKLPNFFLQTNSKIKKPKKKKRRRTDEDDVDRAWTNKFGKGRKLSDEPVERKTRGKQINFKDILDSGESDDDGNIRPKRRRILSDSDDDGDGETPGSSRKLVEEIRAANARQAAEEKLQHEEKLKEIAKAEKQMKKENSAKGNNQSQQIPSSGSMAVTTQAAGGLASSLPSMDLPPMLLEQEKERPIKITNSIVESILLSKKSPDLPDSPPSLTPPPISISMINEPPTNTNVPPPPLNSLTQPIYLPTVIPGTGSARVGKKKTASMLPTPASTSDVLPFPSSKKSNSISASVPFPGKSSLGGTLVSPSSSPPIPILPPNLPSDLTRIAGPMYANNPALRPFHPAWGRSPPPYSGPHPPALGKPPPLNSSNFMPQPGQLRPPGSYSQSPPALRIPNPNTLQAFQQFSKRSSGGDVGGPHYRMPSPHQLPPGSVLPPITRDRERVFIGGSSPYAPYGILPPQSQGQQHPTLFAPAFDYRAPESFKDEPVERQNQPIERQSLPAPPSSAVPTSSHSGPVVKDEGNPGSQGDGEFGGLVSYFSSQHSNDED